MAEVMNIMNMPVEALDSSATTTTTTTTTTAGNNDNNNRRPNSSKSPDNTDNNSSPPPPARRRDRDSRERRDERDIDSNNNNSNNNNNNRPYNRRGGGDYYPPRERDSRDYKRRASPSPPPPVHPMGGGGAGGGGAGGYRDRRHSPSGRRSPPPYKRRRDDGYDGRRGGNRGRFGPGGDRRFPYNDYGGGFERNIGGRPQYDDDRTHGRHLGGPPDWDSGRGGFGDASNAEATQREGLMSYKQFIQELEDDVLPAEAERRYQEYKTEYISTQKRTFFGAHKDEEWFKDKYHPTNLLSVIERRNELARKTAKDFMLDLQSGSLDLGPGINATSSAKSAQTSEPNSDDDAEVGGKRRRNRPTKESDLSGAPKAHPISSEPKRIQVDIEQAQALLRKLDAEKGIEENVLRGPDNEKPSREKSHSGSAGPVIIIRGLSSVKGLEGIELLDTMITYLWRIHGLDYYGMLETSEAKGLRHVRAEGKASDASSGAEWEKKLDSLWQERLVGQDPLEVMTAKEKIDAAAAEALDPYVRKIRDEKYGWKYGCGAKGCTKLFHAAEFVHKHLKLKHPELVMELTSKVREDLYFQNYMNDPNGPGSTPVMQQPTPKDRPNWRRLGLDNRLKDERGNRRDHENRGGGNDRFDRMENLQSMDFQSNNDGSERRKPDEPIIDAFGAQGMHVGAPFSSEMAPPPVLMPVPGAGPLGPFVPAPPEVAMRMFREQGGPPPFEAAGRNVRPGPQLGGGPPFLALSPALRQDPRRLRSYNDLDAPEDEVTVIDYRSL